MANNYREICGYFLKLGFIAFGGPAAHIAMMEKDLVEEKKWLDKQTFLDYIGVTSLIPGPNSTELTMHCGYHRGGIPGLFIAGFSFILPAVFLTGLLAYLISIYGELPLVKVLTDGFKVIVLVIIAQACYKLYKKAAKNNYLIGLSIVAAAVYWFYPNEIVLLLAVAILAIGKYYATKGKLVSLFPLIFFFQAMPSISSSKLFFTFFKIGCTLFGSGYVLFAYLDTALVQELGVLTTQHLMDAIAIGQFTPGPVLSTSTYIGYLLQGPSGAVLATLGIFLPSFFFVLITSPFIENIRKRPLLAEILDGVNVVSLSFMLVVTFKMAQNILTGWESLSLLLVGAFLLFRLKLNAVWILLVGGFYYLLIHSIF